MQVIENRADVRGRVEGVADDPALAGYAVVTLVPEAVADVPGYANLFREAAGRPMDVRVAADRVAAIGLTAGDQVTARVRLAGPGRVFADAASLEKR